MRKVPLAVLALLLLAVSSCQRRSSNKTENHAEEYKAQADSVFELVKEIQLETSDSSLVSFPFDLCKIGKLFFISSRNEEIKVFDEAGHFVRSIGRLGEGPGEYRSISCLFPVDNDLLGVYDRQLFRFTFFDFKGRYKWSRKIAIPGVFSIHSVVYRDGKLYLHIPNWHEHPYHIICVDTSGRFIQGYVPTEKKYEGYFVRNMFNGGMVAGSDGHILYEANSFSYKPNVVDLTTCQPIPIKYPEPGFYKPIPPPVYEEESRTFSEGTDVFGLFLIADSLLVVQYVVEIPMTGYREHLNYEARFYYGIYNLHSDVFQTGFERRFVPSYSDGQFFYQLIFYEKYSPKTSVDLIKNPVIRVLRLKKFLFSK
ncbi:MAG: 6-bladed beta-propeller [Bacteroidota bacterium]